MPVAVSIAIRVVTTTAVATAVPWMPTDAL